MEFQSSLSYSRLSWTVNNNLATKKLHLITRYIKKSLKFKYSKCRLGQDLHNLVKSPEIHLFSDASEGQALLRTTEFKRDILGRLIRTLVRDGKIQRIDYQYCLMCIELFLQWARSVGQAEIF